MEKFYIHLDLDALDPNEGRANGYTARAGFLNENLQQLLAKIASHLPVEAVTIAGYDPSYDPEGKVCAIAFEAATTACRAIAARNGDR
jgi:arginase family enzyme